MTVLEERFTAPELDAGKIPKHVAIIMDGNRRWAKQHGLPSMMGHWEGANVLMDIVKTSAHLGIETLTVYAFSSENWSRSEEEVEALMTILEFYLIHKQEMMEQEGVRLSVIGDVERLPWRVQAAVASAKQRTAHCQRINLVLAINYGSRDEIRRAISKILAQHDREKISPRELTEDFIASHLDTAPFGDPDLLIRSSGELRVSNFLLWQISYAEIYTTEVLWPDFSSKQLVQALLAFQSRSRRKGAS